MTSPSFGLDPARRAWEALAPIAWDIERAVRQVAVSAKGAVPAALGADIELMSKAGAALLRQLSTTVEALSRDDLDEAQLSRLRHDLRTPLSSLKGYCDLLIEDTDTVPNLNNAFGGIARLIEGFGKGIDAMIVAGAVAREAHPVKDEEEIKPAIAGRILLVEDHAESRLVVTRLLMRDGHMVREAADGTAALDLLAVEEFDVVLLDHHLPDFEGNEILKRIKADPRLIGLPIIMVSAGDEARQIGASLRLGADDYIAKPVDPTLLRARLTACLERKRLRERSNAFWLNSLTTVMDLAVDGIVILTQQGYVETANPIACRIFATDADAMIDLPFGPFLGQSEAWTPEAWPEAALNPGGGATILREATGRRAGGVTFPLEIAIRVIENGDQARFVAICRDVTARRAEEERMAFLERHDPVTELANRIVFNDWINEAVAANRPNAMALVLVAVSGWRDQVEAMPLQHGAGILRAIAQDITRALPPMARLASLGNDQFGIAFDPDNTPGGMTGQMLAERVLTAIPRVISIDGVEVDLEAWASVTHVPEDGDNPAHLLRNLDLALARSRREGERTVFVFEPGMRQSYRARRTLERDLAEALDFGQLDVYFQPKVRLSDHQLIGGEALIRWPVANGFIPPSEFIPVAETTGLIVPLGQFVIEETVHRIASWIAAGHHVPTIAVNVSAVQFRRTDLVRLVRDSACPRRALFGA